MQDNTLTFLDKLLDTLNTGYVMPEEEFNELGKEFTEFKYKDYLDGINTTNE